MPVVWADVRRCRGDVPPPTGISHRDLPARLAAISVRQPDLPATGSGPDAGVLWTDFLRRAVSCGHHRTARTQSSGSGNSEAHLFWFHPASVDSGGHAAS